jgi:membrane protein implicated in regulation of membrane protease activity
MDIAQLLSTWWVWMAAALALGILEVLVPGFIFLGFALSAAVMALLHLALAMLISVPAKLALFAGLALAIWYLLRQVFRSPGGTVKIIKNDINDA